VSFLFNGTTQFGHASFTTPLATPFTMACYIKDTAFVLGDTFMTVFRDAARGTFAKMMSSFVNSNEWYAVANDGTNDSITDVDNDITADGWVPCIAVAPGGSEVVLYVAGSSGSVVNAGNLTFTNLDSLAIGTNPDGTEYINAMIARVCVWNVALDASQRTAFNTGTSPASIAASNLRKYFELSTAGTPQTNAGLDSGDMTLFNAPTFNADHPTITGAGVRGGLMLTGVG
jgi:Concanavalin A-like lectin/glucanases superfamily